MYSLPFGEGEFGPVCVELFIILLLCRGFNIVQDFLTSHVHLLRGPGAYVRPHLHCCKCRRSTDVQDRWTAAVEDWCSVQIGVHDTGSWCSCPCGFLPAYPRGVEWQVPMMQHKPWCVPACSADRQSQISWIYTWRTFGFFDNNRSVFVIWPIPSWTFHSRGNSGQCLSHVFYRRELHS